MGDPGLIIHPPTKMAKALLRCCTVTRRPLMQASVADPSLQAPPAIHDGRASERACDGVTRYEKRRRYGVTRASEKNAVTAAPGRPGLLDRSYVPFAIGWPNATILDRYDPDQVG